MTPEERLELAKEQLSRAQVAAFDPEDWAELSIWAFYALENAVISLADKLHIAWEKSHSSKVSVARALHEQHHVPDVSSILRELNELRKSEAYGEVQPPPSLSAEDVVIAVEEFVEAAEAVLEGGT